MKWYIGCSGFHYRHWKGTFYPEGLAQKRWFDYYATHFGTLELNVTFYRFPRLPMLQHWYDQAPEGFRFSVKAPKAITHFKQFHGTVDMLSDFYGTIREGLTDKLGPVLFQFPPRFRYEPERLARVLDQLNLGFDNVLEFRHPGWWRDDVFEALRQRGVAFCGMSHPELPAAPVVTGPVVYYRFHGVPELYRSSYSKAELAAIVENIHAKPGVEQVWCYFNNDAAVAAIPNARTLMKLI
ncbi:Uncharacterized conserved protein YecE, DUF72 family [Mucilaginibacter pineti]|uniref:Uncharacterized conserved protein YecE, DUF72 family n=1 Tax=Mucilaginibacter pineti TaxID=1391627 RepID=A0A1G6ZD48_9SPHI|nr:DUF72 domain-containing protein [Mucilaginibacter pineti]SDE00558.1 Uncharacterized conserved protein YecE, DUF72 family [Mucilaginibacter pineti]